MQAPGIWKESWRAAKPIVAWRQKRLFDDTKEAEKILHTFSALRPAQIATMLLPAVFHSSLDRLLQELPSTAVELPEVNSKCRAAIAKIVQIARHSPSDFVDYKVSHTIFVVWCNRSLRLMICLFTGVAPPAETGWSAFVAVQVAETQDDWSRRLGRSGWFRRSSFDW